MGGHGHVTPRPDGVKARCGGPAMCPECAKELAAATLPPLSAQVTDAHTAQMCLQTGHTCPACPTVARNLGATAHNALGAVRAALEGTGGWDRAKVKLADLERALEAHRENVDAHFAALKSWQGLCRR